ncbi:superoxide dismutase family protein [Neobacillus mesonae]|uniref:superoxide dismutase family protein n=1 Tax=Neobacillus mesonae TaxID=1193713 RepID=UPI002040F24D|nr:superoxide dismutase family protein [Neobacillus mesonae]MCM3571456.1 superoxide dismutase family protein [Neobacillus mesonae]
MRNYGTRLMLTTFLAILLSGCAGDVNSNEQKEPNTDRTAEAEKSEKPEGQKEPMAQAEIKDVNNKTIGTVNFLVDDDNYIQINASIDGLEPGHHGFHIHEKGICKPDAEEGPFTTAGGHFNPDGKQHSGHAGDLPSLYVKEDGRAEYSARFDRIKMDQLEGLAVIVHSNPDNFGNIPDHYQTEGKSGPDEATLKTGDAGDRQACGVIVSR